jgi:hypothetical protein
VAKPISEATLRPFLEGALLKLRQLEFQVVGRTARGF